MSLTINLAVDDLRATEAFYGELLALPVERFLPAPGLPPVLLLIQEGGAVVFRDSEALAAQHPAFFQNLDRHPRGVGTAVEITVQDVLSLRKRLEARGQHLLYELEDREFHRREIWVQDPDGYLVILCEEPAPGETGV